MANTKDSRLDVPVSGTNFELAPGEVVIGSLHGFSSTGEPLVDFEQNISNQPIPAMSTLATNPEHCGRQVALLFTQGNLNNPLIIGFLHSPLLEMIEGFNLSVIDNREEDQSNSDPGEAKNIKSDATVDGKRVVLEGSEEVVLKCGEASITLTKAGKIIIRGKYILNRSTGVNRILGGSVQVN